MRLTRSAQALEETDDIDSDFEHEIALQTGRSRANRETGGSAGSLLLTVLATALVSIGLCLLVGFYASSSRPDSTDRIVLFSVLMVPTLTLVSGRSGLLVDYLLIIVATNRELRRMLDWGQGEFDVTPITSLLSLCIAGVMMVTIASEWRQLPLAMRHASGLLITAMAYGVGVGLAGYGFAAFVACGEWATPLIVLFYCVATQPSKAMINRWITVLVTLGVLAGAYGIYQWTDPPPWDATWVVWSKMTSSMGAPRPYEMSICSTLESRGPAAMFFAATTAMLVALPFLQRAGGVVFAVVPAVALLLTQARTGLIYMVLSLLASAIFARRGGLKIVLALVAVGGLTAYTLGRQEQSTEIFNRVSTLSDLENDGSATGRVDIASEGVGVVLSHPLGFGFGSGGNAARVSDKQGQQDAVGDNGYLEILSTMGVPGTVLYGIGLAMIVRLALRNKRHSTADEPATRLGLGMLVALVPSLMVSNQLISVHASYVWILISRHLAARQTSVVVIEDEEPEQSVDTPA